MTWQLGSFVILALALAGGFAWYERTRPDARIVALVGTLAAFAALGRIAFAALPNIKPTTDIVLITGYALGGAPGFVVGALAGLTSNFFFGQGPWTPWQMAAWGMTGLLGALLTIPTRGRVRRWPLALVCAAVGFAFAAFQDVGDWVTYSDHSAAQLGVYVGKGTGFDLVHAVGCLAFALVFGPALTKSLKRFATRLEVTWLPDPGAAALLFAAVVASAALLGAAAPRATASSTPVGYLLAAQNGDGGFGPAPGQPSSQLYAGWAALGLAAAGENPADVRAGAHSLLDYVRGGVSAQSDPGSLERTILVAAAAGVPATSFGGVNLVAALDGRVRGDGSVSDQVNLTAFAVLALRAGGAAPPARTISWLEHQQDRDGGFNFATAGASSDVDDSGAALQALALEHAPGALLSRAVGFIRREQNDDGGFPSQPGAASNAQSTAWAIQGLLAAGDDPNSLRRGGASPLDYLRSLISADGHVRYARSSDQTPVWVTAEAVMALAEKPLPLAAIAAKSSAPVHAAPTATTARRAAAGKRSARPSVRRKRRARRLSRVAGAPLTALAGDAAVLAAVALAPVGL